MRGAPTRSTSAESAARALALRTKPDRTRNPEVPEGWELESIREGDCEVLTVRGPWCMSVTLDLVKRRLYPGHGNRSGVPITAGIYQGRGWRDRMLADAIAHLQGLAK